MASQPPTPGAAATPPAARTLPPPGPAAAPPAAEMWTILQRKVSSAGAETSSTYALTRRWVRNDGAAGGPPTPAPATPAGGRGGDRAPRPEAAAPRRPSPPPVGDVPGDSPSVEALLHSHRARWAADREARAAAWAAERARA